MSWFWSGWDDLVRVIVVGIGGFIGLVLLLRVTGKRTLSKMNAFDLVVTIGLGSTLSATLLNNSVPLSTGLAGFATLIALQYVVAFACAHWTVVDRIVKSTPTILLWKGRMLKDVMKRERVTPDEVACAVREAGLGSYADVDAVVLETTGSLSVITKSLVRPSLDERSDVPHDTLGAVTNTPGDSFILRDS